MTTNGEYLESIDEHLKEGDGQGGSIVKMVLGEDLPKFAEPGKPISDAIRWEVMAVYSLMQRKKAYLEVIREHLAALDPEAEDDHPHGCGFAGCSLATREAALGDAAMSILSGQTGNIIEAPGDMTAEDVQAAVNGSRLADEVEAYVRDHGEGGYL